MSSEAPFLHALPREHPCYHIPLDLRIKSVNYSNDAEYRTVLDTLCFYKVDDDDDMQYVFDFVWENTHDLPIFMDLYKSAAAHHLFSEDASLGLAIMFSYDYLCDFYPLFREYMTNLEFDETNNLLNLKKKLENISKESH
jgi:hypothetical protein